MKVGLVVDHLDVERGTGIARYSQKLDQVLRDAGVETELISTKPFKIPFGEALNHIVTMPSRVLKKASDFDVIHGTAPITALCFPFLKKPKIVTYHDIGSLIYLDSAPALHVKISAPFFFRAGKHADKVIAVSTQTKEELVKYIGIPEEKIVVIPLGVGEKFRVLEKTKKKKDYYSIGYIGALAKRKRVDSTIQAIYLLKKKYPELKLKFHIYGTGNDLPRLKHIVDGLRLWDRIESKGFAPDEKLAEIYNSFDVFVLSSDWEGFGIPILEAQKCGVPVIIKHEARIPREVSKHCVKVKSEEDMANKVYELLTNPSFKKHVVKKGLEYSKQFTWEKTAEETLKVYELISEGK